MCTQSRYIFTFLVSAAIGLCQVSCKKMIAIPPPVYTITTAQVFSTDAQASSAMAGVYSSMVNSSLSFSNAYATILGGLSADELYCYSTTDPTMTSFSTNQLLFSNAYSATFWASAYKVIYNANSVIEGIQASTAGGLTDSTRQELTAEAKFVRAFSYFYLVNFYGDVPLVMTVDFNSTRYMSKTPSAKVYQQIIQDLKDAQTSLQADYSVSGSGRVRPNQATATALLARVYLYMSDYTNAAAQATSVIGNTTTYKLETDPNNVFLANSEEAIWQLIQGTTNVIYKNATVEGYSILPYPLTTGRAPYVITSDLLNAFEAGDLRRSAWVASTTNLGAGVTYFPYKYKVGAVNAGSGDPTEYYMVLRLPEMYLIRAEAEVNGATGGAAAAVADLNVLRSRAGLKGLDASTMTNDQVVAAVAHERQVELFAEWGHRWLDLKRTGQAHAILSAITLKQPWAGDYQLLYPIPQNEMQADPNLLQNPGY